MDIMPRPADDESPRGRNKRAAVDEESAAPLTSSSSLKPKKKKKQVVAVVPPPSSVGTNEKICSKCKTTKALTEFYKKQRKQNSEGLCKICWDNEQQVRSRNPPPRPTAAAAAAAAVKMCANCQVTLPLTAFDKRQRKKASGSGECKACVDDALKKAKAQRALEDKQAYLETFGVGYALPCMREEWLDGNFENQSVVGDYKIVYYSSDFWDGERIARSACGPVRLRMGVWDGKPALCGEYQLQDRLDILDSTVPEGGETTLGVTTGGTFVESVVGWEGSHIPNIWQEGSDDKLFIAERGFFGTFSDILHSKKDSMVRRKFWNYLPQSYDDIDRIDAFCFATLHKLKVRVPLGLQADRLYENEYEPTACPSIDIPEQDEDEDDEEQDKEEEQDKDKDGLKVAAELMAKYNDASDSWMCQHLPGFNSQLAFNVREFVTPPPVFYLEEGDLVLTVEETRECEWTKTLVLRKIKK